LDGRVGEKVGEREKGSPIRLVIDSADSIRTDNSESRRSEQNDAAMKGNIEQREKQYKHNKQKPY